MIAYVEANQAKFAERDLLWRLQPRGGLLSPGIGIALTEGTALLAPMIFQDMVQKGIHPSPYPPQPPPREESRQPAPLLLDWRQIIVSFVAGILTAILIRLQILEWRRRGPVPVTMTEPTPPASPPEEEASPVSAGASQHVTQ